MIVEITDVKLERPVPMGDPGAQRVLELGLDLRVPSGTTVTSVTLSSVFEPKCGGGDEMLVKYQWRTPAGRGLRVTARPAWWTAFQGPVAVDVLFDGGRCVRTRLNGIDERASDGERIAWRVSSGAWSNTLLLRVGAPTSEGGTQSGAIVPKVGRFFGPIWLQAGAGPGFALCFRKECVNDEKSADVSGPAVAYNISADFVLWANRAGPGFVGPRYELLFAHLPIPGDDPLRTVHTATVAFTVGLGAPPVRAAGFPWAPGAFGAFELGFGVQHERTSRSSLTSPILVIGFVFSTVPRATVPR